MQEVTTPAGKWPGRSLRWPTFLACVALSFVLVVRTTRGIDLTDEMQYYGQIVGLVQTGHLFSNDLFIQQTVYILLYPIFKVHNLFFGNTSLVFMGRSFMALLSFGVFAHAYRKLRGFGLSPLSASVNSFLLTFAIPYHGIFAPSYNTVSQAIWIIFLLRFYEWSPHTAWSWFPLFTAMAFTHPTSAVALVLLVLFRHLVTGDRSSALRAGLVATVSASFVALFLLWFANPAELLSSLVFSSGFGVGSAFQRAMEPAVYFMLGSACFAILFTRFRGSLLLGPLHLALALALPLLLASGLAGGGYSGVLVLALASASVAFYALAARQAAFVRGAAESSRLHWFSLAATTFACTLAMTSGNGLAQATGAFMAVLPILLGLSTRGLPGVAATPSSKWLETCCLAAVAVAYLAHWCLYPYRESYWWRANQPLDSVREFNWISTSPERAAFLAAMRGPLEPFVLGRRALIVSEYPGLYFSLGADTSTCMLYMHSLPAASERVFARCLAMKDPEVILDLYSRGDIAAPDSNMKKFMRAYYSKPAWNCATGSLGHAVTSGRPGDDGMKMVVCERASLPSRMGNAVYPVVD